MNINKPCSYFIHYGRYINRAIKIIGEELTRKFLLMSDYAM